MKINQIAVTLYTVRDFCQNEKDLFESLKKIKNIVKTATVSGCKWFIVERDECNGDPFDSLRISYNNLVEYTVI